MIKNILLDLDDTLLDFHKAEKAALIKTLVQLGIEPEEKTLARYSAINAAQWKLLEQGKILRDELKVRRYRLLFDEFGIDSSAEKAAEYYENYLGVGHYFIDGAEELLNSLAPHYRLFLVSNGTASVQKGRIESAGIEKFFSGIFISQLIGYNKPSREFFNFCFAEIPGFKREESVIVGDSLSSDIQGGKNAGISTIWFNPHGAKNTSAIVPDRVIAHLYELPLLLKTM